MCCTNEELAIHNVGENFCILIVLLTGEVIGLCVVFVKIQYIAELQEMVFS